MNKDIEDNINAIDKKLMVAALIDTAGSVAFIIGLISKLNPGGEFLHPVLENTNVSYGLMIIGGAGALWGIAQALKLLKEKKALSRQK